MSSNGAIDALSAEPTAGARQASRAQGVMFFAFFGGAWLVLWAHGAFAVPFVAYAVIVAATLLLFGFAFRVYKAHAPALKAEAASEEKRRRSRRFHLVNAGQWILVIVVANVLANIGLLAWAIPAAIFIVGAHLLPLARLFAYPPHYVTGVAMMLVAVTYPWVAPGGPDSPVGCLGAGLILWCSAAWTLTRPRAHSVT